jgi:hypothetical protein
MREGRLTALIKLEDNAYTLDQVKRLVLFFDHVQYVLPEMSPIIKESMGGGKLEDASFVRKNADGSLDVSGFNYFRDAGKFFAATLDNLNAELRETILAFEEAGVMSESFKSEGEDKSEEYGRFVETKNLVAFLDIQDQEFIRLSQTKPEDFKLFNKLARVTVSEDKKPQTKFSFLTFNEPPRNYGFAPT